MFEACYVRVSLAGTVVGRPRFAELLTRLEGGWVIAGTIEYAGDMIVLMTRKARPPSFLSWLRGR